MALPFSYEGKRVVVSGGGGAGMGAAAVEGLAELGAEIHVLDLKDPPVKVASHQTADLRDPDAVAAAVDKIGGKIDALFNAAGLPGAPFPDVDTMLVNFKSALYGMQAVLPHFKQRGSGQVINVSSMLGRLPLTSFRSAYIAAKHALNGLTGAFRQELRAEFPNIIFTTVSPAVVATDFGLNARGGGPDSRLLPMAQPVEEVADVIVDVIDHPRVDVYTRPGAQQMVADYYASPDMAQAEAAFFIPAPAGKH